VDEVKKHRVSKLDAAKRQLDCAIGLWFEEKDEISTHTLVGAAYQIIHDLNKKRGGKDLLFDADFIKDEYRKEVREFMRKDFMFFKHADHDPDGVTEFVPVGTLLFILCGIQTLRNMGERMSDIQSIFAAWMLFNKPEWVSPQHLAAVRDAIPIEYRAGITSLSKQDFLQLCQQGLSIKRAH